MSNTQKIRSKKIKDLRVRRSHRRAVKAAVIKGEEPDPLRYPR